MIYYLNGKDINGYYYSRIHWNVRIICQKTYTHTHSSFIFKNIFIHVNLIVWNKNSNKTFLHFFVLILVLFVHILFFIRKNILYFIGEHIHVLSSFKTYINLRILSIRPHMKTNNSSNIDYPYRQNYIFSKVLRPYEIRIYSTFLLLSKER